MANHGDAAGQHADSEGGMPLDAFNRGCPPGWRPGIQTYPFRRYMQLVRLWWRQTDVQEHQVGPIMVGRLRGAAFQLAMSLRQLCYDADQQIVREHTEEELLA